MAEWRRSSYSGCNGNCAEVARHADAVWARDSKDPGPVLKFSPAAWRAFLDEVKAGA